MLNPATYTEAVFNRVIGLLAPIFLLVAGGNADAARAAAVATLATYEPRTNRDLRLAALAIAFGFGALEALSRASDTTLTVNQVLRLRGNAAAMNRAAHQNEARLEKQARTDEPEREDLPVSAEPAELMDFLRPAAPAAAQPAPVLSRQQRRLMEREAEKQRVRAAEKARLEERAARRMAEKAAAADRQAAARIQISPGG